MADIDIVLERLVIDKSFRAALSDDPAAALAPYDLNEQDLQLLAGSLADGDDAQRGVEQRTSKSAMVGLLASVAGGGGPPPGADDAQRTNWWKFRGDSASRNQSPIDIDDPAAASKTASLSKSAVSGGNLTSDIRNQDPIGVDSPATSVSVRSGVEAPGPGPEDVAKTREAQNDLGALRSGGTLDDADISVSRDTAPASGPLWDSGGEDARLWPLKFTPGPVSEQAPPAGDVDMDGRTAAPIGDYNADGAARIDKATPLIARTPVAADNDFLTVEDE